MTVDIEGLSRPEHDDGEEVGAGNCSDDQCQGKDSGFLLHSRREHGELCEFRFPDGESDEEEYGTENKRCQHMGGTPFVLVATPLETSEEQNHADDGESSADKVDFTNDLFPGQAARVGSRWWEVKEQCADETDNSPETAQKGAPAPAGVTGNQLSPKDRWAEGDDGENEDGDVFASLAGWSQLGSDGQRCEFANTSTDSGEGHAHCEGSELFEDSGKVSPY